jgi:hypothetical protein
MLFKRLQAEQTVFSVLFLEHANQSISQQAVEIAAP